MLSPHGNYLPINGLKEIFFDSAMMGHCIFFFTITFIGKKSVLMFLLMYCLRFIKD